MAHTVTQKTSRSVRRALLRQRALPGRGIAALRALLRAKPVSQGCRSWYAQTVALSPLSSTRPVLLRLNAIARTGSQRYFKKNSRKRSNLHLARVTCIFETYVRYKKPRQEGRPAAQQVKEAQRHDARRPASPSWSSRRTTSSSRRRWVTRPRPRSRRAAGKPLRIPVIFSLGLCRAHS